MGRREVPSGGVTSIEKKHFKGMRSVPKVLTISLLMLSWSPLCW